MGYELMKGQKLEHRLHGLRMILDQIYSGSNSSFYTQRSVSDERITQKIKSLNIFEFIYGDNYHNQMV